MDLKDLPRDHDSAKAFLDLKPSWSHGDQKEIDAVILIGLARLKADGRFLEIGTSAGEGAAALLYGAKDGSAELTCLDLATKVYYDKSRNVGDVVPEALPDLAHRFTIHSGVMSNHVFTLGQTFDLVHIDAAHRHPWGLIDLLCATTRLNKGALVAFHDANYTVALSQAAYYFSRVFAEHGHFLGNHFVFEYRGPTPDLVDAILATADLNWQGSIPPRFLAELHTHLHDVFSETDTMRIMSRLLERNHAYLAHAQIYKEIDEGLWKREMERRRLLNAAKD